MPKISSLLPHVALAAFVCLFAIGAAVAPNGGGSPPGRAGAPDDGDGSPGNSGSCWDAGCHNTFAINSGGGTISLTTPGFYAPGDTLDLQVSVDHAGAARYGFQITARDASGQPAGSWIAGTGSQVTILNPNYVTHQLASTLSTWSIRWIAPDNVAAGDVVFYYAGNAADGRFNAANDYVYTGQKTVAISTSAETTANHRSVFVESVYPNPADDVLYVRYAAPSPAEISLFDLEGRLRERRFVAETGAATADAPIAVDALPVGVYLLRVTADGREFTRPVLIQR